MGARYYTTHNALRGIAAIAVSVYHLQLEPAYRLPLGWATPLLRRGYLWVDLFFMLSGFVLAATYLGRLSGGQRAEVDAFLRARIARIFPLHLFVLVLLAGIVLVAHPAMAAIGDAPFWAFLGDPSARHLAAQAALVQIWDPAATMSWNIPSWSISAEMYVYFTLPVIAVLNARRPRATPLMMLATAALIYGYIIVRRTSLDILDPLSLARCLAGFLVGVTIQQLAQQSAQRIGAIGDRAATALQMLALSSLALLLLSPLHDVWVVPALALLVASTVDDRGLLARLCARPAAQRLGHYSFALYLLNIPVLLVADLAWPRVAPLLAAWPDLDRRIVWSAAILSVLLFAAAATFHAVEAPARDRLRALTRVRRRQSVVTASARRPA